MTTTTPQVDALAEFARPEMRANPYPFLHWLRENDPVHKTGAGFYLLSTYDDVFFTLQHTGTVFGVPDEATMSRGFPQEKSQHPSIARQIAAFASKNLPHYARLRSVMAKDMTVSRVGELWPQILEFRDQILDQAAPRLRDGETVDLHTQVSTPLTQFVFARRVGVPTEDRIWIAETIALMMKALGPTSDELLKQADEASDQVEEYFRERISERRRNPEDDMITSLVKMHDSYSPEDDRLLLAMLWIMWMTGYESTIAAIDRGMQSYLDQVQYRDWLVDDDAKVQSFVEESLRHDGIVLYTPIPRISFDDLHFSGVSVPAGSVIRCLLAGANRDPAVFADPDRFDPSRNLQKALNMGYGMFHCSGAALGRAEITATLTGLHSRFPSLTAAGKPKWSDIIETRCVDSLPARLADVAAQ